jgi:hypothetical protein
MTQIKKSQHFLRTISIAFIGFIISYTLSYYLLATREVFISHSYKQFLLQHAPGQRLIIDSGSNSFFGINSTLLEQQLGLLTINLADNAGYPLKSKLLRIEKYSHQGDIILLPLEWQYYTVTDIPDVFLNHLLGNLNYYHQNAFIKDLQQIWQTPFANFIAGLNHYRKSISNDKKTLKKYLMRFNHQQRGDYREEESLEFEEASKVTTCDQYVLGNALKNGFKLSTMFMENTPLIKRLQTKGVHIIFTWPVVVGQDCYSQKYATELMQFIHLIKQTLHDHGLFIIGDPYENKFSEKFMLNSYYHITAEARDLHTQRLIKTIKQSAAYLWFNTDKKIPFVGSRVKWNLSQ